MSSTELISWPRACTSNYRHVPAMNNDWSCFRPTAEMCRKLSSDLSPSTAQSSLNFCGSAKPLFCLQTIVLIQGGRLSIQALTTAIGVLNAPLRIEGTSSAELAADINRRNRAQTDAKLSTAVSGLDRPLRMTAVQALLELARASRTPKDRSVAAIYEWWAFLRYLAFFDQERGYLTVGPEGRAFINNQRRVASEELGVAFSLLVGRRWIDLNHGATCATSVTDVELALAGHLPNVAQLPGRTMRPDWLLTVHPRNSPLQVFNYMLESKGTASNGHVPQQLARGVQQLTAVTVDGATPPGLAVSTVTGKGRVRYFALDPEAEREVVNIDPDRIVQIAREGTRPRTSRVNRSAEYLASAGVYWSLVELADFARNSEAAESLGFQPRALEGDEITVRERHLNVGPVDGVERSWRVPGGRLSVVLGVASEVNDRLRGAGHQSPGHVVQETLEAQSRWAAGIGARDEGDLKAAETLEYSAAEDSDESFTTQLISSDEATAVSSDGAILSVRIE